MEVPAHDDGIGGHAHCTMAQLFTGLDSEYTSIYHMDPKSDFPHALEDFIQDHGAMHSLHSANAKEQISSLVQDIFKMYLMKDSQSEAHQICYKFGVKIPHTYPEAVKFDTENSNTLWNFPNSMTTIVLRFRAQYPHPSRPPYHFHPIHL